MKTQFKRMLLLALSLIMAISVTGCKKSRTEYSSYYEDDLAGYASKDTSGGQESKGETKVTVSGESSGGASSGSSGWKAMLASMPNGLRGTTITIGNWNDISDVPGLKGVLANFTKETGIKVNWHKFALSTYGSELAAMVSANKAPDVVRMKYFDPAVMVSLQPLSKTGYDFSSAEWDQSVLKWYSVNGKQYAVNLKDTLLQQPSCMLYNTKLISKYDLQDPYTMWKKGEWTWSNFIKLCEDFLKVCPDGSYPYSQYHAYDYAAITGMAAVDWNGKQFVSHMGEKQFLQACLVDADMKEKGITTGIWFDRNGFEQGKVLFFCESLIGARTTHYYFKDMKNTNSLEAVPYPTVEGQENYQLYGEYEAYAVPKNAKNVKAVPYFLYYYLDAANYNEKTFFASPHMLEVHKAMRANTKIYSDAVSAVFTEDTGVESGKFVSKIHNTPAAQMKTVLDEYSAVANNAVAASNKIMEKVN